MKNKSGYVIFDFITSEVLSKYSSVSNNCEWTTTDDASNMHFFSSESDAKRAREHLTKVFNKSCSTVDFRIFEASIKQRIEYDITKWQEVIGTRQKV